VQVLRADPFSGAVFVFRGKRGDYLKILTWDGSGLCLFANDLASYCVVLVVAG
jgi:transposase